MVLDVLKQDIRTLKYEYKLHMTDLLTAVAFVWPIATLVVAIAEKLCWNTVAGPALELVRWTGYISWTPQYSTLMTHTYIHWLLAPLCGCLFLPNRCKKYSENKPTVNIGITLQHRHTNTAIVQRYNRALNSTASLTKRLKEISRIEWRNMSQHSCTSISSRDLL